jgi:hypothetical protein
MAATLVLSIEIIGNALHFPLVWPVLKKLLRSHANFRAVLFAEILLLLTLAVAILV